mgnify:CR=1 FL=1
MGKKRKSLVKWTKKEKIFLTIFIIILSMFAILLLASLINPNLRIIATKWAFQMFDSFQIFYDILYISILRILDHIYL